MQVLMSEAALARVRARLASAAPGVEIVTLAATGALRSNGAAIATASPEAAWLSRDLFRTPLLAAMADYVLKTPSVRWVQTFQAGLDNPMFRQMMAGGVRVTKSNAQAPAIAEYVVAHAISLLHPIEEHLRRYSAGNDLLNEAGIEEVGLLGERDVTQFFASPAATNAARSAAMKA